MSLITRAVRSATLLMLVLLPQQPAAEGLRHGQGLLWQVGKDGRALGHVFGTIHLSDPEVLALPPEVKQAFDAASSLSIEAVLDEQAVQALAAAMALPGDRSLQDIVPAKLFEKTVSVSAPYGLQALHLKRLKPWAVAMLITVPPDEQQRRRAGHVALDVWLQQQARAQGKPIHGLETMAEQIAVFDGLPIEDQVAYLRAAAIDPAEKGRMLAAMKKAYLRRDLDAIRRIAREGTRAEERLFSERLEKGLLDVRNRRMVERMRPRFEEGNAFIAIGALHLPGDTGVLHLLEEQGYTVTRVY